MNLSHIYNLYNQLQNLITDEEKEYFLINNKCKDFDSFLKFVLNPHIKTGITKNNLFKDTGLESPNIYEPMSGCINNLSELLEYLTNNNTGKNIDIWYCQKFIDNFCYMMGQSNDSLATFLIDLFTKNLKLNINTKLINKVYGNNFID